MNKSSNISSCCGNDKANKAKVVKDRLCYCFKYSKDDFRNAIFENKETELLEDIKAKMKDPGCFCETANPSGKCCLADINKFIQEEKSK